MSDTVSFAELDGQHVELLPARTVLSMFSAQDGGGLIPKDFLSGILPKDFLGSLLGTNPAPAGSSTDGATGAGNS